MSTEPTPGAVAAAAKILPPHLYTPQAIVDAATHIDRETHAKAYVKLRSKVDRIKPLLQQLAGNRKLMQLAGPARQALNILNE